jgi:purine-binding chemotaxis protein CheW
LDKLVTFLLNDQIMAVDSSDVERIIKFETPSKVPNSSPFLEGVINYQESVIPVTNMKIFLNLKDISVLDTSNIIVISKNGATSGMLVDYVDEIIDIDEGEILKDISNESVRGVVKVNDNIVTILNPVNFAIKE